MLIYLEIWAQSLSIGARFVLPNVVSLKFNVVPGGGSYRFHLRDDLLRRPLKGRQSTFAAIFLCVPTTFGNDCSSYKKCVYQTNAGPWNSNITCCPMICQWSF